MNYAKTPVIYFFFYLCTRTFVATQESIEARKFSRSWIHMHNIFPFFIKHNFSRKRSAELNSFFYQLDPTFQTTKTSSLMPLNSPICTVNILSLSFTYNQNWKLHISSLAKTPYTLCIMIHSVEWMY